ncbi:MAG: hypothetical protein ACOVNV_02505, partial [Pirellulaceae bacterium]
EKKTEDPQDDQSHLLSGVIDPHSDPASDDEVFLFRLHSQHPLPQVEQGAPDLPYAPDATSVRTPGQP